MEVYLNSIEMGDGIYGAEAVAQLHFSRSALHLTTFPPCSPSVKPQSPSPETSNGAPFRSLQAVLSEKRTKLYVRRKRFQETGRSTEPRHSENMESQGEDNLHTQGRGKQWNRNTDAFQSNYYGDGLSSGSSHHTALSRVIFPSGTSTYNYINKDAQNTNVSG